MSSDNDFSIPELAALLSGEVICSPDSDHRVRDFAASDLLSDILACPKEEFALLTGLNSAQVIRTADITGAVCVVILRGKQPAPEAVKLAESHDIPMITTPCRMFEACRRISRALEERVAQS